MQWWDVNNEAFKVLNYSLSYVELVGTIFGLLSVFLAAKANIITWPTGIINELSFFIIFYQVQLYSDMFLQLFFFVVTLYGWYFWNKNKEEKKVRTLNSARRSWYIAIIFLGTVILAILMSKIHQAWPDYFPEPAAYPIPDAFTTVASIVATVLLSRRLIETWFVWIAVDIVAIGLYFERDIKLIAIEYIFFLVLCIFGYLKWRRLT